MHALSSCSMQYGIAEFSQDAWREEVDRACSEEYETEERILIGSSCIACGTRANWSIQNTKNLYKVLTHRHKIYYRGII